MCKARACVNIGYLRNTYKNFIFLKKFKYIHLMLIESPILIDTMVLKSNSIHYISNKQTIFT